MSMAFVPERLPRRRPDGLLLGSVLLLQAMGLVVLFSASYHRSTVLFGDGYRFLASQAVYAAAGIVVMLVTAVVPPALLRKAGPVALLVSMGLLAMPFLPGIGAEFLGGRHWIRLGGFTFQPVELVKVTVILYLAGYLDARKDAWEADARVLLPPFGLVMVICLLIFLQNDLSSALIVFLIATGVFFAAGVKFRHLVLVLIAMAPAVVGSLYARSHRIARINTYFDAARDPMGDGYQVLASLSALKAGGLGGRGIGEGLRKLGTLPEAQSDFIFAVLGEELGFVGVVLVIGLFALLIWRGLRLGMQRRDLYLRLLAFGASASIAVQVVMNLGVVSALLPATGITLPFFSAGGSSLICTLMMCGILVHVDRQPEEPVGEAAYE